MEKIGRYIMKKLSLKEAFDSQKGFEEIINFSNNIANKMNQEYQNQQDQGRNFDYGQNKSDSGEGNMAKNTCKSIISSSQQLDNFLRDQDDIPEWCQTYLAVCQDRLETVLSYLKTKGHDH